MNLVRAFRLSPDPVVAFLGAGGKTTALFRLARDLAPPVIVTTTTHLGTWQASLADRHITLARAFDLESLEPPPDGVLLVTGAPREERLPAPDTRSLERLYTLCRQRAFPLLIEADGARGRPLKAPAAHEPVVPAFVSLAVVVAGMNGLGKPLDEAWVHRPERFAALTGLRMGQKISSGALAQALTHPEGGLKGIPPGTRRVALLNQADTTLRQSQAASLAKRLLEAYESVVIASCEVGEVHAVHERVAGILLAAGGSTRFGQPKQLLTYRGQPFVRRIAQTALQAGLSPLVVVTGAHAARVEDALAPLPVNIVHNPAWRSGQASSIRGGLETVLAGHPVGAAIFLLADQPQVSLPLLRSLVEEHARTLSPVVAPLVRGRRATPVLFDRVTFPALLALQGDRGGRATFSTYPPAYLPWHDETLLLDVDTPEDYDRLLRLG